MHLHNMLKSIPFFDKFPCVIYFFEKKNDCLPMHDHTEETYHVTIVTSGSVLLHGPNFKQILKENEFYDYKENEQTHEIIALEDNTKIINISKYLPKYDTNPEELEKRKQIFIEKQRIFIENQQKLIKQLEEEEDRRKGIIK